MNGYSVVSMIGFYAITSALIFDFLKIESTLNKKNFILLVMYSPFIALMIENQKNVSDVFASSFAVCLFLVFLIFLVDSPAYVRRIKDYCNSLDETENKDIQNNSNSDISKEEGGH